MRKICRKCQFFALNLYKFTPGNFFYTDTVCGVFDKYEVWLNVTKEIPAMTKNVSTKRVYADNGDGDDCDEGDEGGGGECIVCKLFESVHLAQDWLRGQI